MDSAIARLTNALPEEPCGFVGSEYAMPVSQALLGRVPDTAEVRALLDEASQAELKERCEPAALAAEAIESCAPDRADYFLDDGRVRSLVFQGAKWRAGWVLLAGDGIDEALVRRLKGEQYILFAAGHEGLRDVSLPARGTGAVYFLQLMVRYAMTWGQIAPGDDHDMGHFLERDMPGAMVVRGGIGQVEGLLLLALMKMGCPAVVDDSFPYDIGPRAVAQSDDAVLEALASFPNMRQRTIRGETFSLPEGADPTFARETFTPARALHALVQVRPPRGAVRDGTVAVSGPRGADALLLAVEVDDPQMDLPLSAHLEAQVATYASYLRGVRTTREEGAQGAAQSAALRIELAEGVAFDPDLFGRTIHAGLKRQFPRLGPVQVTIEMGAEAVARAADEVAAYNRLRDEAILGEKLAPGERVYLCIDCQPFAHSHVCVTSPERPPMCGRSPLQIKAGALWGVDYRPWTRRDLADSDLQYTAERGEAIDAEAGEWVGINAAVAELSGGLVQRVRIHSVSEAPHTSCGCFGALAFVLPEVGGIGLMHRGYQGEAPGGLTWSILANRAGGKQADGVTGISLAYLESLQAFGGEGGLAAVKWATTRAYRVLAPHLPPGARVATEEDATTLDELRHFLEAAQ